MQHARRDSVLILLAASALLIGACALPALAETLHVPRSYATIQNAVDAAADGDEVIVAPGIYAGPGNRDVDLAGKAITVRGSNPGDPDVVADTIINCGQAGRGFLLQSGESLESVIDGLTITDGLAAHGAAIDFDNASSGTIRNCILIGNTVTTDGGVINSDAYPNLGVGDVVVVNCTIVANTGIGVATSFNNSLTVINTGVVGNTGSGIVSGSLGAVSVVVRSCSVSGNGGAGIAVDRLSAADIADCTIAGNGGRGVTADYVTNLAISNCGIVDHGSSGIRVFSGSGGSVVIRNCLVANNTAAHGAGIFVGPSFNPIEIVGCTLTGNVATETAGGLRVAGCHTTVRNCIIWGDDAPDGPEILISTGTNPPASVTVEYSDVDGGREAVSVHSGGAPATVIWGDGNIQADPLFTDQASGDLRLLFGSPARDYGDPQYTPAVGERDLDGHARVLCGRVDMGAYEAGIGDANCDGVVDVTDYAGWSECETGPTAGPFPAGCEPFDVDGDGDVDLRDFAGFGLAFTGAI